jgi:hypothetical protein
MRHAAFFAFVSFVSFFSFCVAADAAEPHFRFRDVAEEAGLFPAIEGIRGHGAGWGDADGDGWPELFVGTFHTAGGKPCLFFRSEQGKFRLDDQASLRISARATGVVFADFDNDGDLDLYVGSMPAAAGSRLATREGHALAGCSLFRNEGAGKFTNVSEGNSACPAAFGGRSAAVLDFDGDGLLDLLVGEDPNPGYNGSPTKSTRLFRNRGGLQFEDASRTAGLPEGIPGLGVAAADVNNDGWPDLFLASSDGGNVLLLNDGRGKFRDAPGSREVFAWEGARGDNMVCGVAFGDVNRDGWLDVVLGQHYERPWQKPVTNRLYLQKASGRRNSPGNPPSFEDVTDQVGLAPLTLKSPHVEVQDFDNDGWPDIFASFVKFDRDGSPHPIIFRNRGVENDLPRFECDALGVNDFPTPDDKAVRSTGTFFDKLIADRKAIYTAPGPTCDYDRDGKLDMVLPNWWQNGRSLLLKNQTPGGHWLQIAVAGSGGVNRQGIGTRILVYPPGRLGDRTAIHACQEIAVGFGYASGQEAIAHIGLGDLATCDVQVIWPHAKGSIERRGVNADQRIVLSP